MIHPVDDIETHIFKFCNPYREYFAIVVAPELYVAVVRRLFTKINRLLSEEEHIGIDLIGVYSGFNPNKMYYYMFRNGYICYEESQSAPMYVGCGNTFSSHVLFHFNVWAKQLDIFYTQ